MSELTTQDLVRFHIDASLDAMGLLSESERAELCLELAASLVETALQSLADRLPPGVGLDLLRGVSELRACAISERNRRENPDQRADPHAP
jgi:hypothetical protein